MGEGPAKIRLDKWLWHARFFKTRSLSAKLVSGGHCRVNGSPVAKPAFMVGPGDILTFPKERDVRVIRIVAPGERRGPAPEAQALYEDLDPPKPREREPQAPRYEGGGRPTKKDRRALDKSRPSALE
ncbi:MULTISPECIES: RNA-binding S4 domain-containing protein [Mameliella]|uniref:Heat shock protein 15 n=1 Tax=Mameliella alba TaxID=561184 RepID=A0A0B3SC17_9RHOB|nr:MULTISPECIES: RNA-binding S4 domain-containing protein [Mameliella]KHQ54241.1 Heat shock protein 15 [Mameliella alba]MDD9733079.1 RNA-binding S4 domain-containing protein [Mameliella sp. AT18]ODM47056.1 RNA-binding protein S4 [Ruegeria sp. PBVC088]